MFEQDNELFIWWDETEKYNKIEHEDDNEIINYIKI